MGKRYLLNLILFSILLLSFNPSHAETDLTGIWVGNILDVGLTKQESKELGNIYFSIHQTENSIVVVILTSVEKTGDLFASTYIGKDLSNLESYGEKAFFPVYFQETQSINYPENIFPLKIHVFEDNQSAVIYRSNGGSISLGSIVEINKIL